MKRQYSSVDGFVPKRSGVASGNLREAGSVGAPLKAIPKQPSYIMSTNGNKRALGQPQPGYGLGRSDITESLQQIDGINEPAKKISRRKLRRLKKQATKRPKSLVSRIIKWLIILVVVAGLSVAGYMFYKLNGASGNILQGNIFNIFKDQPLKQDSNGRSNFLILGTSEDDPGHDGSTLTDSILIVSVDQANNNAYMFSVPRDLYVSYGTACNSGYYGKINEYFNCVNDGSTNADEQDRLTKTQKFIGSIFGLDIQYGVHVNYTVLKEVVDAIGGIDVDIQGSNGDSGILDRNFDWACGYKCYYVKYEKDEVVHLDGIHALALARARGASGGYGLSGGNFDREQNQQKIIKALQQKALSAGTLTNVGKVTGLIDALGDNLRTNISSSEIRTAMNLAANIKPDDIISLSLVDKEHPLVKTSNISGQSVVVPIAGLFDYTDIRAYIKKHTIVNDVSREKANVAVYNATGQSGLAKETGETLTNAGYNVTYLGDAPSSDFSTIEIYQTNGDKEKFVKTRQALEKRFSTQVKFGKPKITVKEDIDFVIILGDVPQEKTSTQQSVN